MDAVDEQMSQGPEDIPLSDSGSPVEVSQARGELDQTSEQHPAQPLDVQSEIPMHRRCGFTSYGCISNDGYRRLFEAS